MTERTERLRRASLEALPTISHERASLLTEFYQAHDGKYSIPVMRARSFHYLCEHKTIYLGDDELIVGERGPFPKAVPTYPELTCHALEDLEILDSRPKTSYACSTECRQVYEEKVIPYWRGRSMRDKILAAMTPAWIEAYEAGIFTEFMEQRAPGHTVLDDKIYRKGLLDFKRDIALAIADLDYLHDPRGVCQARATAGDGHRLRRADPVCATSRRSCQRAAAARESDRAAAGRAGEDRRCLPPRAGTRTARFPRGAAVLLVLPSGGDHRVERLGLVQPRASGPASGSASIGRDWKTGR